MSETRRITDARRALGRNLASYRRVAAYSQHQLAPLTGYGRSTIANVEVGRQNVPRDFWQRCDDILDTHGSLTAVYDQLQRLVREQHRANARLEMQATAATHLLCGADSTRDNGCLGHATQYPARVDLVAVAQLQVRLQEIATAYDDVPSVSLLACAGQIHRQLANLRDQARDHRVRRNLYALDAEASTIMGQLVWDASQRRDHATSLGHFDHAIAAGQAIDDGVAVAHAVLRKSYIALYGVHDPQTGLALASRAAQLSSSTSHTLAGIALLHVAEAHGQLHNQRDCEIALDEAEQRFGLRTEFDPAAGFYAPSQLGRLAGSCYLSLDLPAKAERYLTETSQAMQDRRKVSALVLGNLSLALIRQRKLDEATAVVHAAIDEVERTRGGGALNVIFAAGRELRPWRQQPAVQEVHDRLLALMA